MIREGTAIISFAPKLTESPPPILSPTGLCSPRLITSTGIVRWGGRRVVAMSSLLKGVKFVSKETIDARKQVQKKRKEAAKEIKRAEREKVRRQQAAESVRRDRGEVSARTLRAQGRSECSETITYKQVLLCACGSICG